MGGSNTVMAFSNKCSKLCFESSVLCNSTSGSGCNSSIISSLLITEVRLFITEVHPFNTEVHLLITEVHHFITEVHLFITEVNSFITEVHLFITEVNPFFTEVPPFITEVHLSINGASKKYFLFETSVL